MNRKRVIETIKLLKKTHKSKAKNKNVFDYAAWGRENDCCTHACAGGEMTMHKPFNDEGFNHEQYNFIPKYRGFGGFKAISRFLDINLHDVIRIFCNLHILLHLHSSEITALNVAEELQKLIDDDLTYTTLDGTTDVVEM